MEAGSALKVPRRPITTLAGKEVRQAGRRIVVRTAVFGKMSYISSKIRIYYSFCLVILQYGEGTFYIHRKYHLDSNMPGHSPSTTDDSETRECGPLFEGGRAVRAGA